MLLAQCESLVSRNAGCDYACKDRHKFGGTHGAEQSPTVVPLHTFCKAEVAQLLKNHQCHFFTNVPVSYQKAARGVASSQRTAEMRTLEAATSFATVRSLDIPFPSRRSSCTPLISTRDCHLVGSTSLTIFTVAGSSLQLKTSRTIAAPHRSSMWTPEQSPQH